MSTLPQEARLEGVAGEEEEEGVEVGVEEEGEQHKQLSALLKQWWIVSMLGGKGPICCWEVFIERIIKFEVTL